jgi:hypothetical protein
MHSPHFYPAIPLIHNAEVMGFNKRKMEDARRQEAEKAAAARRATDRQILEDAEQLDTVWNERRKISLARADFWSSLKPMFPGTGVSSLISGIDVSDPGTRLQSMTRRE